MDCESGDTLIAKPICSNYMYNMKISIATLVNMSCVQRFNALSRYLHNRHHHCSFQT